MGALGFLKDIGKAVAGPAVSIAGDLFGSAQGAARSRRESKRNRKFQERMSRHAVRYRVEDLKAAGINPILAASMGLGGGSPPSGAMAQQPGPGDLGTKAAQTGLMAMMNRAQLNLVREQTRKTGAEADVIGPKAELYKEGLEQLRPLIEMAKQWFGDVNIPTTSTEVLQGNQRKYLQRAIDEDDVNTALGSKRRRSVSIRAGRATRYRGVRRPKTRSKRRLRYRGKH